MSMLGKLLSRQHSASTYSGAPFISILVETGEVIRWTSNVGNGSTHGDVTLATNTADTADTMTTTIGREFERICKRAAPKPVIRHGAKAMDRILLKPETA